MINFINQMKKVTQNHNKDFMPIEMPLPKQDQMKNKTQALFMIWRNCKLRVTMEMPVNCCFLYKMFWQLWMQ